MSSLSRSAASAKSRALAVATLLAAPALLVATLTPSPARAWWRGGFFIGVPPVVVAPGPVGYPYYYPPAYYPPYPAYYPPAAYYPPPAAPAPAQPQAQGSGKIAYGASCFAGVYQCAAPAYSPIGQGCTCPGLGAPSYGTVQ